MGKRLQDLTGMQFGKLKVIERVENDKNGNPRWLCLCTGCGKEVAVYGKSLRSGRSRSCGSARCRKLADPDCVNGVRSKPNEETLCFSCENALCNCTWSQRFKPVPGWVATPTVIKRGEEPIHSFHVHQCPMYKPDQPRTKAKRKKASPFRLELLERLMKEVK